GELSFEDAYQTFAKMVRAGNHADGILIETMTDLYELKAAVLAAKENADLPVFASVMVDRKGKLLTGADIQTVVALLEGLRVDALGLNCGFGPEQMQPYLEEMLRYASLPVLINPNAGMPTEQEGKTIFSLDPSGYSAAMQSLFDLGPAFVGGCCGTTPLHLKEMISRYKDAPLREITEKSESIATSYSRGISLGHQTIMIGEKLNPTGNKPLSTAIKEENLGEILDLAIAQKKAGAQVIEVNMGLAGIDQKSFLPKVTSALQGVLDLPLMIDTSDIAAMEAAVRIYNGKPLINSVNGKPEVMDAVFPIVKKYGGIVVGLTLDEQGIPSTPEGRVAIAKKIIDRAADYGIDKKDILIDTLTMTISANQEAAATTLTALKQVKEQLGVNTVLGVSNVSFGLPQREIINTTFYTQALLQGLDAAILNPFSDSMKNACYAHRALHGQDPSCLEYIAAVEATPVPSKETGKEHLPEHS
ncbi:MAG: dihydropteroate synthase, partial [Anaerovoracaceae bacterium]